MYYNKLILKNKSYEKMRKKFEYKDIIFMRLRYNKFMPLSQAVSCVDNIEIDYDIDIISDFIGFVLVGHIPRITLYTYGIHHKDNHKLTQASRLFTGLKGFMNNEFPLNSKNENINHLFSKYNNKYFNEWETFVQRKLEDVDIEIVQTEINKELSQQLVKIINY